MGWAKGSLLAERVWEMMEYLGFDGVDCGPAGVAFDLVKIFEYYDCDTMYECGFVEEYLEYDEDNERWIIK